MFLCSRAKRQTQTSNLMFFCPYVLLFPALAASESRLGASPSVLRVSGLSPNPWKTCSTAQTCKISTPKLGIYTSKPYICPVGHKKIPPVCAPANQHSCPPAGTNGHVRRPRAQNCAIFFARRNALAFSELRPFQEKFPKISPNFLRQKFGVCAKSPYLCTRKSEMRPTTPHKSEAIRSLKTLHKTIL